MRYEREGAVFKTHVVRIEWVPFSPLHHPQVHVPGVRFTI